MNRLILGAVGAALIAVLVLAGTSYTGGDIAHAQGQINYDVDPDPSGNTASTLGTVEKCFRVDVATGALDGVSDVNIDIVVTGDTLAPVSFDTPLSYDNTAKVNICAPGTDDLIKTPGGMSLSEGLCGAGGGTDGLQSFGVIYLAGGPGTAGSGTIVRVGLDIDGSTAFDVNLAVAPAPPPSYSSLAGPHSPITVDGAKLSVNKDCPLDEVDLSVDSVITAAPTDLDLGVDGTLTVQTTGTHTGAPLPDTVEATISHAVTAPAGCTATTIEAESWTGDLADGASQALVTDYTINCTEPSTHEFVVDNVITLDEPGYSDPTPGNDTDQELPNVNIWTDNDIQITGMTVVCPRMIDSDGNTSLDLCVADVSTPLLFDVEKDLDNVAGAKNPATSPVEVNITKTITPVSMGTSTVDADLVTAGVQLSVSGQAWLPLGASEHDEEFEIHCADSDVGSLVVFAITNTITVKDAHIVDADTPDAQVTVSPVVFLCVPRFTPSFLSDIDEDDGTMDAPVDDTCIMGLPCKSLSQTIIPADVPKQPLALIQTFTPAAIDIRYGLAVTNGATVGQSAFSVVAHIQGMTPACVYGVSGVAVQTDACLDPASEVACTNNPTQGVTSPALIPPGAFTDWAQQLTSINLAIQAMYPGAVLWTHVVGLVPAPYTPINILTWNLGTAGYLTIGQTGDPDNDMDFQWDDVVDPDDDNDGVPDVIDTCPTTIDPTNTDTDGDGVGNVCDPNPLLPIATDPETYLCSPYSSDTISLGETMAGPAGELLRTCETFGTIPTADPHIVAAALIRADIGLVTMLYDTIECITAETDLEVELVKDENIEVGEDIESTETVHVVITNGVGPTRVDVELTQVSTDRFTCVSHLVPEIGDTLHEFTVGNQYYSKLSWEEPLLAGSEVRDVTRDYTIVCSEAGSFPNIEQFVVDVAVNLIDLPDGDPNPLNNTDENHVSVDSDADIDDDTVPNDQDNCPDVPNPGQEDLDTDGEGDECDDDDDGDGVDDGVDECPTLPGDPPTGCPESDVDIDVIKDETPVVDASQDTLYPIQVIVTNGDDAAEVDVDLLLVSEDPAAAAGCTISWGDAQEGLDFVEEVLEGMLQSQLSGTLSMAADAVVVLDLEATLHCFEKSLHTDAFELAAGAAPLPPVWDGDSSNNILKNFPDVTVLVYTDVKKVDFYVEDLTDIDLGVPTAVDVTAVIHNNGDYGPVDISDEILAAAVEPADCEITPDSVTVPYAALPVSVALMIVAPFEITCNAPSTHHFDFDDEVTILTEHVVDTDEMNNIAEASLTVNVWGEVDVTILDQYFVDPPTEIDVSEQVVVTLRKILQASAPVEVLVSKTASASSGASIDPPADSEQVTLGLDPVEVDEQFTIHCEESSTHYFTVDNVVTIKDAHVLLPSPAFASTEIAVDCIANADVKITDVDADPNLILAPVDVDNPVDATVVHHNNGPQTATVTKTVTVTSAECSINGAMVSPVVIYAEQQTDAPDAGGSQVHGFTLDVPAKGVCYATVDACKGGMDDHVVDPNPDNNCDEDDILVCSDSDYLMPMPAETPCGGPCPDGIADPEAHAADPDCGPPDNCPDHYNPGQVDTDGDTLGDACDPTPYHDDTVKSLMVFGPAPINISDNMGRYMWIIGEIGNLTDHDDTVELNLTITPPVPAGCTEDIQQILPGRDQFILMALEQKWVLFRVRYECHSPAMPGIYPLNVELCIDHIPDVPDGDDTFPANDCQSRTKSLLLE